MTPIYYEQILPSFPIHRQTNDNGCPRGNLSLFHSLANELVESSMISDDAFIFARPRDPRSAGFEGMDDMLTFHFA